MQPFKINSILQGLTSWKGDKVRKHDVTVAKNYLTQEELSDLNRIVTMYLEVFHQQRLAEPKKDDFDQFLEQRKQLDSEK